MMPASREILWNLDVIEQINTTECTERHRVVRFREIFVGAFDFSWSNAYFSK